MAGQKDGTSIVLQVLVQPKASEDLIVGFHGEVLKVRVTASPKEGRANQRLIKILAKRLGIVQSCIEIIHGHTSRKKVLRIWNVSAHQVKDILR